MLEYQEVDNIHAYNINGISLETGDLICTVDGNQSSLKGQFWWLVGKLIPGEVDHIAIYVGPEGRCVEACAKGRVIAFNVDNTWDAQKMYEKRAFLYEFYGIAYPLSGVDILSNQKLKDIRIDIANYCLKQAKERRSIGKTHQQSIARPI